MFHMFAKRVGRSTDSILRVASYFCLLQEEYMQFEAYNYWKPLTASALAVSSTEQRLKRLVMTMRSDLQIEMITCCYPCCASAKLRCHSD